MAAETRPGGGGVETASVVVLISGAVAIASVAVALSARGLWTAMSVNTGELASVIGLAVVLALVAVPLYGRGSYDYSGAAVIAAGLAFGVGAAMLTAFVATGVHYVRIPGKAHRALFSAATLALAGAAATAPSGGLHAGRLQVPLRLTCAALGALL